MNKRLVLNYRIASLLSVLMVSAALYGCANASVTLNRTNEAAVKKMPPPHHSTIRTNQSMANTCFFVPRQLPPKIVLHDIEVFPPQIDLGYAREGYNSKTPEAFWIQEYAGNQVPIRTYFTTKESIRLNSKIAGMYYAEPDGPGTIYELIFDIPSKLTRCPSMILSLRSNQTPYQKAFSKTKMVWIANQVIANAMIVTR
ncbi:MAG: hypothetical protein ACYCVB_09485 [Bacilli bacterium]